MQRQKNVILKPLRIVHPLRRWLQLSIVSALISIGVMVSNINVVQEQSTVHISTSSLFWLGAVIYAATTVLFFYLFFAKKYRLLPAGTVNLERVERFISNSPKIANEFALNRYLTQECNYQTLKDLEKSVNQRVMQEAKASLLRRHKS